MALLTALRVMIHIDGRLGIPLVGIGRIELSLVYSIRYGLAISLAHRSGEGGGLLLVFTVGYRRGRGKTAQM